ncbi:heme o synthase [Methylobacter sp. S3L5C]|uniref:heme o synthase n=1 Tax=Methylobacter sp. S3L5C TaxID=2839024 RepID=UPI001FAE3E0F|nr:heme o synthase [Methylobacter sp. S3L5C]UOA07910.1 heme o synthase [Methylobacter sp. S3L5C]
MPSKPFMLSWKNYLTLCKPNVVAEMLFTAVVGMLLAVPGMPPLGLLIYATVGIALAASSAAAINHFIDRKADAQMARTEKRPLPTGELNATNVITFAVVLGVSSMLILILLVNTLTAVLTFLSLFGYAIIYTLYLKRATPQNIVIGGIFGATPPLLGWCAMTGEVHPFGLLLALIIFVWTPPHFWALAIARREEYAKVNIPMLPVTHGVEFTRLQILLYTILLLIVTLLPYLTGMSGLIYLGSTVLLDLGFIYYAVLMMRNKDNKTAMKTFVYSIVYITLLFAALLIDHYIRFTL